MTKEEALNKVKNWTFTNEKDLEVLQTLIPELKESKNERIRKALIKMISDIDGGYSFEKYGIVKKDALAYLEKHKEQKSDICTEEVEYADKYSHDVWEKLMSKFKNIEGYSIGCNDVSDIVLNAILNAFKWKKDQENKPQFVEWSEENEQLLGFIYDLLDSCMWRSDWAMSKEECLERLKSLHPQPGLSKEDFIKFGNLEYERGRRDVMNSYSNLPHWKPSEEQLGTLLEAKSVLSESSHFILADKVFDIFKELKKLWYERKT